MRKQMKDGLRKWMAMGLAACLLAGCGSGGQNQAGGVIPTPARKRKP